MYLSELISINYKCCQKFIVTFAKDDPTILIGINDCGKSTILQAIGLLFDVKPKFSFLTDDKKKSDISNTRLRLDEYEEIFATKNLPMFDYTGRQCIIIGKFVLEEDDLIDSNMEGLSNHLLWAIENATDNSLWLAKVFDESTMSCKNFILTLDDTEEPLALYNQKNPALNKKRSELGITNEEIENDNRKGRFKNLELVRAIYARYSLQTIWSVYNNKTDTGFFPEYRYLDWNISMEQLVQFTNDIINTKIDTQLKYATKFANRQAQKAQEILNQELDDFTQRFTGDLPNITGFKANINFDIKSSLTDILINKTNSDGDIHLDSQGDGVKRQIWFALIKWNALNSLDIQLKSKKFIWGFDEPETHLYPKAQREFFDIIKDITLTNVQSILSTHSTVFIDRAKFENINKIDLQNGYSYYSKCHCIDDIYESLQLKNSDFLFFDKFLVVEGDTEQEFIPVLYKLFSGHSLLEDSVQLVNLGGKDKRIQNHKILEGILKDFQKTGDSIIYIFDNDAKYTFTDYELRNMTCYLVGRQDIEDSITSSVWKEIIDDKFGSEITVSVEEIEAVKQEIPNDREEKNANNKFYPRLKRHIRKRLSEIGREEFGDDILPSKGTESGKLLSQFITTIDQIDGRIKDAFEVLNT